MLALRELGPEDFINIMSLICPAIKDPETGVIVNMDYQVIFTCDKSRVSNLHHMYITFVHFRQKSINSLFFPANFSRIFWDPGGSGKEIGVEKNNATGSWSGEGWSCGSSFDRQQCQRAQNQSFDRSPIEIERRAIEEKNRHKTLVRSFHLLSSSIAMLESR